MTWLMVSPWAPYRDGIASYAQQEVRHLRAAGHDVTVLSPLPSAAHHHLRLGGATGAVRLARHGAGYDRVIVQFGPELLFGQCRTGAERVAVWAALAALARTTDLELRIHEIEYDRLEQSRAEAAMARTVVGSAHAVTVHTEAEHRALLERLGPVAGRISVVAHGRHFSSQVDLSPLEAKAELGLDPDRLTLLCIGFLQHHKGFDLAIEALAVATLDDADLHIVGSGRIDHPEIAQYVSQLRAMADRSAGVTLHEGYVSDELFDRWLLAADVVVLPYREIWSSGVVERARLFDKPIIASDLPQLRDQLPADAIVCGGVGELADAMAAVARRLAGAVGPEPTAATGDGLEASSGAATVSRSSADATASTTWDVDRHKPDRSSLQRQIEARAGGHRAGTGPAITGPLPPRLGSSARVGVTGEGSVGSAMAMTGPIRPATRHLEDLGSYQRPPATSLRPLVGPLKQSVETLTNWQIDPLTRRIEDLHQATVEAVLELEARVQRLETVHRQEAEGGQDQPCEYSSPVASDSSARRSSDI
jgi:glycosyltransferase involved in cell wall biosynthesis